MRLAFLDVLQTEQSPAIGQGAIEMVPAEYRSAASQQGVGGWLRRNSGLLGLLGVLLLCLIVGLLVGHWVSQGSVPSKSVVEVKGLSAAPAAATTAPASTTPASTTPTSTTPSQASSKAKAEEAKEKAQEAKAEKKPLPAPVKASAKKLSTNPKKHEEEINSLGDQPIETG